MDNITIEAYNKEAKNIAKLHSGLIPQRVYDLISQYFTKNKETADIGCGIGRDTYWLNQHNFPTVGIDASEEMLNQAKFLYPENIFILDSLPSLEKFEERQFDNILCSAVLMHLDKKNLQLSCIKLLQLLKKDGHSIISFRETKEINNRENGKLYEPINIESFLHYFENEGCEILLKESEVEIKRNLTWHNIVIKK